MNDAIHAAAAEGGPDAAEVGLLAARLRRFLPAESVITDEEQLRPYECDGLSAYRQLPMVVVIPETYEQVAEVLAVCSERGVPVVARGAGTSLSGGAMPLDRGVLLSLARFNRILEIDPDNRCARVEPGVRNLAVSQAAEPFGLFYAPDPSSQIACTIGGNVAENSGGVHCLKYGLTVHNVLGLKVLTVDGQWLELGGKGLDGPGLDLLALMNGSEGMLGLVMEATVRLTPLPERTQVMLAAFDDLGAAGTAVAEVIGQGVIPAGLEMMDNPAIRAAEDYVHAGYPTDAAAILLCELDGTNREVSEEIARVREILQAAGATEVRTAESAEQAATFWSGRKAAFPATGRLAPDYYCIDGTIPRKHLGEVLARIGEICAEHGLASANVFHAGDGNLHPLVLYDANRSGDLERAEAAGLEILQLCVDKGGTITGEHGVGVEKLDAMCGQFAGPELARFHAVKAAFDPEGLLNPGKAVPTLKRCAEFGGMHVHHGKLPFPDLPRF
ncbi:MAG TPA: FAD-linked oxidase C-terminal domain-containing protein [Gammaproteobacteria bacterium]|nr:FAD-linked oxidase C-terminal domain-containing protein [Gammaproteobacteria bacterium]